MKSTIEKASSKTAEIQAVKGIKIQAQAFAQVGGEESLMEEFSSLLDKISTKLEKNANSSNEQGIFAALAAIGEIRAPKIQEIKEDSKKTAESNDKTEDIGNQKQISGEDSSDNGQFEAKIRTKDKDSKQSDKKAEKESEQDEEQSLNHKETKQSDKSTDSGKQEVKGSDSTNVKAEQQNEEDFLNKNQQLIEDNRFVQQGKSSKEIKSDNKVKTEVKLEDASPEVQEIGKVLKDKLTPKSDVGDRASEAAKTDIEGDNKHLKAVMVTDAVFKFNEIKDISALLLGTRPSMLSKESAKQLLEANTVKAVGSVQGSGNTNSAYNPVLTTKTSSELRQLKPKNAPLTNSQALKSMEKVENALKEVAKSKDGKTISLRLDPPDLGLVKIDVKIKDGGIHARLSAESSSVTQLLTEKAHELQSILKKAGLNVDQITISVNLENNAESFSQLTSNEQGKNNSEQNNNQSAENNSAGDQFGFIAKTNEEVLLKQVYDHWVA